MEQMERPLREGDGGPYGDLTRRVLPDGLVLVFMPSLAVLLGHAEELTGTPLTEEQILRVRDAALAVVTPVDVAAAVEQSRGYTDMDAARPWESWQVIRKGAG